VETPEPNRQFETDAISARLWLLALVRAAQLQRWAAFKGRGAMMRCIAVLAVGLFVASCQSVTPRTWDLPAGVKAAKVNGYEMAYIERGAGIVVILVHGSLSDYRSWAAQMEPFGTSYRAISVSLRHYYPERWDGSGQSFSIRQHAEDLASFIKELSSGKVHMVAHSRGADVALRIASAHPELLRSLVLVEPAPLDSLMPKTPAGDAAAARRREQLAGTMARFQKGDIDGGLEHFVELNTGPGTWKKAAELQKQVWRDNAWPLKHLEADAVEPFTCGDANKISVPVLLVGGEKSPPIFGLMLNSLQPCFARQERVTIPNASHIMARTHPQLFNAAVLAFLARN
jgi:pimeloyl-ACP methyl ester carboxylesterase